MESNQNSLERYQRTQMRKENIIEKLRERGCRITKQRQILLDVILKEECSCCKEIYYKAARRDSKIGMATVYRMMNMLEEIGAEKLQNRRLNKRKARRRTVPKREKVRRKDL